MSVPSTGSRALPPVVVGDELLVFDPAQVVSEEHAKALLVTRPELIAACAAGEDPTPPPTAAGWVMVVPAVVLVALAALGSELPGPLRTVAVLVGAVVLVVGVVRAALPSPDEELAGIAGTLVQHARRVPRGETAHRLATAWRDGSARIDAQSDDPEAARLVLAQAIWELSSLCDRAFRWKIAAADLDLAAKSAAASAARATADHEHRRANVEFRGMWRERAAEIDDAHQRSEPMVRFRDLSTRAAEASAHAEALAAREADLWARVSTLGNADADPADTTTTGNDAATARAIGERPAAAWPAGSESAPADEANPTATDRPADPRPADDTGTDDAGAEGRASDTIGPP